MENTLTRQEYLEQHKGQASVHLSNLFIGLSEQYEGDYFYYASNNDLLEGPFYFGLKNTVKDLMKLPLKEKEKDHTLLHESVNTNEL